MSIKFVAIAAITLDGKIAKDKNHPSDWTSKEDKEFLHKMLDKCDVILVGNNTYQTAIKPLSKRNCIVFSRSANKLTSKSANLIYVDPEKTDVKKNIHDHKYKTVAILGGAQTYTYCLINGMMDELCLTIEPIVFGKGIDLFSSKNFLDAQFKLISIEKLNQAGSLLLRYKKNVLHLHTEK